MIFGDTHKFKPSQVKKLEKLFSRKLDSEPLVPAEFARELYRVAIELGVRLGALVDREGDVLQIIVGKKDILYLPDLGRYRFGKGRLRALRLIFTDLSNSSSPSLPNDIIADLEKLRLDAVISIKENGNKLEALWAHLTPTGVKREPITDLFRTGFNSPEFFLALEEELAYRLEKEKTTRSGKTRAVLVHVSQKADAASSIEELKELCRTAGIEVAETIIQSRIPDPKTYIGKGKLEEVVLTALRLDADLLVIDGELKPTQWRSVIKATDLKILDRSMVILDIFGQRATSADAALQVELAQLKYNLPRLTEMDSGMSRLSGGIGGRGPGETKLEVSRRRARDKIALLEKRIKEVAAQRGFRRERRTVQGPPIVAIVGYTNVGKSTLFNALTKSTVLVENKLFATLEPAKRKWVYGSSPETGVLYECILADTVGFIRDLPNELMDAFRATLEEIGEAAHILHVLDASDPIVEEREKRVREILEELGFTNTPTTIVLNKVDKISPARISGLLHQYSGIPVSAVKREGFDLIRELLVRQLQQSTTLEVLTPL